MKTTTILLLSVFIIGTLGCTSTVTLGPKANKDGIVGASASPSSASVTVPFIKAEAAATTSTTAPAATEKKK